MKTFYIISIIITLILIIKTNSSKNKLSQKFYSSDTLIEDKTEGINCNSTEDKETSNRCFLKNMDCDENLHNCKCKEGYVNYKQANQIFLYCYFEQKKQLTAFLLELFLGFGAGHFYRKAYLMACLKIAALAAAVCVMLSFSSIAKTLSNSHSDCAVFIVSIIYYAYSLGIGFWYVFDLIYFAKNKYQDYSNIHPIDLKHW